jgi:uncharacterized membrane protein
MNRVMYENQVINVQRVAGKTDYLAVVLFYICGFILLSYFIIRPHRSVEEAFLLGFLVNGVFEFANKAIFKKWEYMTVVIDTLWGGTLYGLITLATYSYFSR